MAIIANYFGLVPAGGHGARFGSSLPKQYVKLGSRTIVEHSVAALLADARIHKVFVVCAAEDVHCAALFADEPRVRVLALGGAERVHTVHNALQHLLQNLMINETDWVLVHDAARPGLRKHQLARLIDQASAHVVGGLLALPVADTLKRAKISEGGDVSSHETVSRDGLWAAQTPQMFRAQALELALAECLYQGVQVTDEASAIEIMGMSPLLVQGGLENMKITRPEDLLNVAVLMGLMPSFEARQVGDQHD